MCLFWVGKQKNETYITVQCKTGEIEKIEQRERGSGEYQEHELNRLDMTLSPIWCHK